MIQNLIYHKKRLYYLLCNIPEKDRLKSEDKLLGLLLDDIELMAELEYDKYMKGE